MKTYTRRNKGTCSSRTTVTLNDDNTIAEVQVQDGCNGNLKGVCTLLQGMPAKEAVQRLRGIRCGFRSTSCPDQIAIALEEALQN